MFSKLKRVIVNFGIASATRLIEKKVNSEALKVLLVSLLDIVSKVILILTDDNKDNETQLKELVSQEVPTVLEVSKYSIQEGLLPKIENEKTRDYVELTMHTAFDMAGVFFDDDPDNKAQIEEKGVEFVESLSLKLLNP